MFYNITMIPLNFLMYLDDVQNFMLIEPAWSLGAEMQFYMIIPSILMWRIRDWVVPTSLLIFFTVSMWFFGMNPDTWAYRLLLGVLFVFLAGSYAFDANKGEPRAALKLGVLYVAVLGLFGLMAAYSWKSGEPLATKWTLGKNYEVYLAILVGIPLTVWLGKKIRKDWDEYLGNLSYGLFLSHMLPI
ncbi:MAG: peptidoglycan/LPS O-acetylase OafA/YrhL [Verrucomicrobiales bacterium]|jgi:peptidoglycan/LPS O-acetylase OafA/YrhL